jgi:hypothetical protein
VASMIRSVARLHLQVQVTLLTGSNSGYQLRVDMLLLRACSASGAVLLAVLRLAPRFVDDVLCDVELTTPLALLDATCRIAGP